MYKIGDCVNHPEYGIGKVCHIEYGSATDTIKYFAKFNVDGYFATDNSNVGIIAQIS